MALHNLSWLAFAQFSLGDWPAVVEETCLGALAILGDRREAPPYFTAHAFGAAAFIHDVRGDPRAIELLSLLRRFAGGPETRISRIWLAWIEVRQGRTDEVEALLDQLSATPPGTASPVRGSGPRRGAGLAGTMGRGPRVPRGQPCVRTARRAARPPDPPRSPGGTSSARRRTSSDAASTARDARGRRSPTSAPCGSARGPSWTSRRRSRRQREDGRGRSMLDAAAPDLERAGALIELERLRSLRDRLG